MAIELQDKLYTSAQVADVLGVSLRTLYRYMEDGRIESMKTASGRHRFTKEQILTFLDGGGLDLAVEEDNISSNFSSKPEANVAPDFSRNNVRSRNDDDFSFYAKPKQATREESPFRPTPVNTDLGVYKDNAFDDEVDDLDDDLDDLDDDFNFNFDNKKTFQEPAPVINRPVRDRREFSVPSDSGYQRNDRSPVDRPQVDRPQVDRYTSNQFRPNPSPVSARPISTPPQLNRDRMNTTSTTVESLNIRYYKSDYNDLIDLAKRVKETALTRDLEYAFTLNAGLSLHYPIDPFTLIHFYVNPEDLQAWKSTLGLIPVSTKNEANVGILVNTDVVFIPTKEISGFKVVEDKVLLKDLARASEESLVRKFRQHIMGV